jgi:hypothetical protein
MDMDKHGEYIKIIPERMSITQHVMLASDGFGLFHRWRCARMASNACNNEIILLISAR